MVCFPCGSKGTVGHPTDGLQATGCFSAHEKNRVCLNASVSSETVSPDRSRFVSAIECGCASNRCGSQPPGCGEPQKCATAHYLHFSAGCSRGDVWATIRSPFSCPGILAWGLSALCALFPPGEAELLPAPSPFSPIRIPLRITPPYPAPSLSPHATLARNERKYQMHDYRDFGYLNYSY